MKIRLVKAELFHEDKPTDITKLIVAFFNISNAAKKKQKMSNPETFTQYSTVSLHVGTRSESIFITDHCPAHINYATLNTSPFPVLTKQISFIVRRCITTFRSTTGRIYVGDPIR
jgi:hypothetical protein